MVRSYSEFSCEVGMHGRIHLIRADCNGKNADDGGVGEKKIGQVFNEMPSAHPTTTTTIITY